MRIRVRIVVLVTAALLMAALALVPRIIEAKRSGAAASSQPAAADPVQGRKPEITVGASIRNDTSIPLREMKQKPMDFGPEREANVNPKVPHFHRDAPDRVIQNTFDVTQLAAANMPSTLQNFNGIQYPGVACNCAPPDTNGEVGATQYVQMVNEGFQVFDKTPALRCWDRQASRRFGRVSAAFAKRVVMAIRSCSTIKSPIAGSSRSLPARPFRLTNAWPYRRRATLRVRTIVTIFILAQTSSIIRTSACGPMLTT